MGNTITAEDLQSQFATETKVISVPSWGDAKVEIKKLTIGERQRVQETLTGDVTVDQVRGDGGVEIKISDSVESTYLAVSLALVAPKFKVAELKNLPEDAAAGITEIYREIEAFDKPGKSKAASSSSKSRKPLAKASQK